MASLTAVSATVTSATRPGLASWESSGNVAASPTAPPQSTATTKSLRDLLNLYQQLHPLEGAAREGILAAQGTTDDEHAILTYAVGLESAEASELFALINKLEARAVAARPEALILSIDEAAALHKAFNKAPAQLHPALLGFLDTHRAAAALALCLAPLETAERLLPRLCPILLAPDAAQAATRASAYLDDVEAVEPLLAAFRALPLSAQAAVASELPPSAMGFCIAAACPRVDPAALGDIWRFLDALGAGLCPSEAQLTTAHATLRMLGPGGQARLARSMGSDAGSLLEAAPHLEVTRWVPLVLAMKVWPAANALSAGTTRPDAALDDAPHCVCSPAMCSCVRRRRRTGGWLSTTGASQRRSCAMRRGRISAPLPRTRSSVRTLASLSRCS